jgi:Glycosyl hydrolase family 12
MHRSEPPQRHSFWLGRRRLVAVAAIVALLCAAAVMTVRQLGSGPARGPLPVAAIGLQHSAASAQRARHSVKPSQPSAPVPAQHPVPGVSHALVPAGSTAAGAGAATASAPCMHPQFTTSSTTGMWASGSYFVSNNMWNSSGYSVTQTLYACAFSNWYVVANMNNDSGNGAVKTYPNVQENFNEKPISSFRSVTSTFAETSPHVGIYEDAYDMWLNGVASSGSTEVMIWTENFHQVPSGSVVASVTLGGRAYQVWKSGSYIAFVADTNFTSGTMNLLQFYDWIIAQGWIPASSGLGQIDYGAELVSTNSAPATFSFTNFSISTS